MKRYIYLLFAGFAGLFLMSCEGPQGPPGENGTDGTDGTDGVDGNATCLVCHNLAVKGEVTTEWMASTHGTSAIQWTGQTTVQYAGVRNDCAKCHSHEGFVETQHTGLDTLVDEFIYGTNIQCKTCHDFHETLDFATDGEDYALRTKVGVKLLMNKDITIDFGNSGNLCTNCHQPRRAAPTDDGSGNFEVTSTHYGPHHGPQSTVLKGIGAYVFTGSSYPTTSVHVDADASCITCHMHREGADGVPSHKFDPEVAACTACHSGATSFDVNSKQTEIQGLMTTLTTKLQTAGLLDVDGHPVKGTYPVDQVGALYNHQMVFDDRSDGVHNYAYIKAVLDASIAVFN